MRTKTINELKADIIAYYSENGVPKLVEKALNSMFHEQPTDPNGYISLYFEKLASCPVVSNVNLVNTWNNLGMPANMIVVSVMWRGQEKVLASLSYQDRSSVLERSTSDASALIRELFERFKRKRIDFEDIEQMDLKIRSKYDALVNSKQEEQVDEILPEPKAIEPAATSARSRKSRSPTARRKEATPRVPVVPTETVCRGLPEAVALSALSLTLCLVGTKSSNPPIPLYAFMAQLANKVNSKGAPVPTNGNQLPADGSGRLPLPIITVFNGPGRNYPLSLGKCRCIREILLIPKPDQSPEQICHQLFQVKREIDRLLIAKPGLVLQLQCPNGAPSIRMDVPDQAIDILYECLNNLELGERFLIGLDLASSSIFDESKGKYEPITGSLKTAEELVAFYTGLLTKYKDLAFLINPFRKEDKQAWSILQANVGDRVLLVTSNAPQNPWEKMSPKCTSLDGMQTSGNMCAPSGPGVRELASISITNSHSNAGNEDEDVQDANPEELMGTPLDYSAWMFDSLAKLDCFLVSELVQALAKLHAHGKRSIFAVDELYTAELWPVDLAIGFGVHFLKLGGLTGEERVGKLLHWLNISRSPENDLAKKPKLYSWGNLNSSVSLAHNLNSSIGTPKETLTANTESIV